MQSRAVVLLFVLASFLVAVSTLECYTCTSSANLDCVRKPGKQLEVEECPENDECVTAIISGVTHRGCLSNVIPNKVCTNLCEKCKTSLCNVHIYPPDRLFCYQCLGSDCIDIHNSTVHIPLACPIYKETDRCYTNIISENTAQRGCEATDLTSSSGCQNICLKCNYNGCNNETGVTRQYCHQCSYSPSISSQVDYGCLRNQDEKSNNQCALMETQTCYNKVLHGHKGKCFTYVNEQTKVVNRGCSSAMGFYPTGNLTQCYGDNCNSDCLDIMCNVCDSKIDPNCRTKTSVLQAIKCSSGTHSCFSCEEGLNLWRGCGPDLPQPKMNQVCYHCRDKDGCNRESIRSCYKCSSLNEGNCANWTDISNISISNCSNAEEQCVSTLVSKFNLVYTVRGCASHVSECTENDPFCERCDGSLCNDKPKNWELEPRYKRYWLQRYFTGRSDSVRFKIDFFCFSFALFFVYLLIGQ